MSRRVIVVGAGIVGASVAAELGARIRGEVTVIEQAPEGELRGSTGHAPGFVGILNEASVLTELARDSVRVYRELPRDGAAGFDLVGGLEIAQSPAAAQNLTQRADAAAAAGLPARCWSHARPHSWRPAWSIPRR